MGSIDDDIFIEPRTSSSVLHGGLPDKFCTLNTALEIMKIGLTIDQKSFVFNSENTDTETSWQIANSARARTKSLAAKFAADRAFQASLVEELREFLAIDPSDFDCSCFLSPILTKDSCLTEESADLTYTEEQADILVLFGSPASAFQLLFSIQNVHAEVLDILLEAVAGEVPNSVQLLSQLLQPVGLRSFYASNRDIEEVVSRLMELFKIIETVPIKGHILHIIPELLATPVNDLQKDASSGIIINTVQQLIELLDSITLANSEPDGTNIMVNEILECICQFPLEGPALVRFKNACKDLIYRSAAVPSAQQLIPTVVRSLFASEVSKSFTSDDYCGFVSLLRSKMSLVGATMTDTLAALVDTLTLAFRSNRPLKFE